MSTLQLFLTCVVIWGTTWIAITFQLGKVAPEASVAYRFLLASVVLFIFCRVRRLPLKFSWRQHFDMALLGVSMFCISYILVYYAELYIVSGMVAVGYSASPMINMLSMRFLFGTPITWRVTGGALLGIVGIVFVFWPEFANVARSRDAGLGALLTMLSVIASSAGSMVATRNQRCGLPVWQSMAWGMLYGSLLAFLITILSGKALTFEPSAGYLVSLLYLAIFGSVIAFGAYLTLIQHIGAARASYIGVMVPVVALGISFFFEKFIWQSLTSIGVALLLAGNVLILSRPANKLADTAH